MPLTVHIKVLPIFFHLSNYHSGFFNILFNTSLSKENSKFYIISMNFTTHLWIMQRHSFKCYYQSI